MRFQLRPKMPAHLPGLDTARPLIPLKQFDRRAYPRPEPDRCATARFTIFNSVNNTLSQVIRERFCHACWPPTPAHSLNHKFQPLGITFHSVNLGTALGPGTVRFPNIPPFRLATDTCDMGRWAELALLTVVITARVAKICLTVQRSSALTKKTAGLGPPFRHRRINDLFRTDAAPTVRTAGRSTVKSCRAADGSAATEGWPIPR